MEVVASAVTVFLKSVRIHEENKCSYLHGCYCLHSPMVSPLLHKEQVDALLELVRVIKFWK